MIEDLSKETYQSLPPDYCYESHVEINTDIYDTSPMIMFREQEKIISYILSFVSDDPEEDELIYCMFPWDKPDYEGLEGDFIEYYYGDKKILEVDTGWTEHHNRMCFQYRVFGGCCS